MKEIKEMTHEEEISSLSNRAFSIIELVEIANIPEQSFLLIRKKLLNLGNDILRLAKPKSVINNGI